MPPSEIDASLPATLELTSLNTNMTFLRDNPYLTRVHVRGDGEQEFSVPPHWHERHEELFRVLKGRLEVLLGITKRFYGPEDGEILIPRGVVHSLHVVKGEECIFEERTEPMDGEKELFFRNALFGGKMVSNFFLAMMVMYHGDTIPALPGHLKWVEKLLVTVIGHYVAPFFGYKLPVGSLKKVT